MLKMSGIQNISYCMDPRHFRLMIGLGENSGMTQQVDLTLELLKLI